MKKEKYKCMIKEITIKNALMDLNENQGSKSRKYDCLKMAPYLCPNEEIFPEMAKFIARLQCHMVEEVKANYKSKYGEQNMNCSVCKVKKCTQQHLLECPILIGKNEQLTYIPNYNDLFETDLREQAYIASVIKENVKIKNMLEENAY